MQRRRNQITYAAVTEMKLIHPRDGPCYVLRTRDHGEFRALPGVVKARRFAGNTVVIVWSDERYDRYASALRITSHPPDPVEDAPSATSRARERPHLTAESYLRALDYPPLAPSPPLMDFG